MTLLGNNGLINSFFGLFGLGPFKMLNTSGAVVLGMVYNYLPYMILPLYTVMEKICLLYTSQRKYLIGECISRSAVHLRLKSR